MPRPAASFLDGEAPLTEVPVEADVALRTARRWMGRLRECGPAGLARQRRSDVGTRRLPADLVRLIEGLALTKPRP